MILVTGANGLLGSYVCRKLLEKGEVFKALKRKNSDLSLLTDLESAIDWIEGDLADSKRLEELLSEITTVIHCAAVVSFDPSQEALMHKVNVEGTKNLVDACLLKGVRDFVHVSSIAALGRAEQSGQPITEQNKWVNSSLNTVYAQTKHLAELEVWRAQAEGLQTVIVNPSVILGPGDWEKSSARIFKYIWDERSFYPAGSMNYVDIRDVSEIIYRLYHEGIRNERFIVNAGEVDYQTFLSLIAQAFGKKAPQLKATKNLLKVARLADKLRALLTGGKPLITRETARLANKGFRYDNRKLTDTLHFRYRSLQESVQWCCQELQKRYR